MSDLPLVERQIITLGGAYDPDDGMRPTPIFELRDRTFNFPYVNVDAVPAVASVGSSAADFYLDDVVPFSECGLCSDADKAIVYSQTENFDCSNEGENTVSITVLNNIGVSVTKTAVATVVGQDSDADGTSDQCDDDNDGDGTFPCFMSFVFGILVHLRTSSI